MAIPKEYQGRSIYHFTHLFNLENILKHGLLSKNIKEKLKLEHKDIAYDGIQQRRADMDVPCGPKGVVHDYVPFYFCKRSSMLLAIINNKIADEQFIMYFQAPITIMDEYACVFSDAAANTAMPPNFFANPKELNRLNWKAIDSLKWSMPTDALKQARMAELLIYKQVNMSDVSGIIVWNDWIKEEVQKIFKAAGLTPPPIKLDYRHYFDDFYNKGELPPVTGPFFIRKKYDEITSAILKDPGGAPSAQFESLGDLRDALKADFGCLEETAELAGLESDNPLHREDVATHTLKVVEKLNGLPEYEDMKGSDKRLAEVAAYLHDIGKGPKSRWPDGRQKVDPDHPIKALPMLKRILTKEIKNVSASSVGLLCKLVCYHDLVGDIVGKGRRVEELEEIVEDERELSMLIALGKADMLALNPIWLDEHKVEDMRRRVLGTLKRRQDKE